MVLTLVVIFALFPALLLLEGMPIAGMTLPKEDLYLVFGLLSLVTLLLAGTTVALWRPDPANSGKDLTFPKEYRVLEPISILQDRTKRGRRPVRRKADPPAPQPRPEPAMRNPSRSYHDWLNLPLFPREDTGKTDSIMDLASNGLLFIDNSGKVLCANHITESILGRKDKGLVGISVTDILPKLFPDTEESGDAFDRFTFKGEGSEVYGILRETFFINKSAERVPVKLRMSKQESHGELIIAIEMLRN
tara:strand:- start:27 stop:770 length:744 start_codon:yes stop_codon:yes gene_type:complete